MFRPAPGCARSRGRKLCLLYQLKRGKKPRSPRPAAPECRIRGPGCFILHTRAAAAVPAAPPDWREQRAASDRSSLQTGNFPGRSPGAPLFQGCLSGTRSGRTPALIRPQPFQEDRQTAPPPGDPGSLQESGRTYPKSRGYCVIIGTCIQPYASLHRALLLMD